MYSVQLPRTARNFDQINLTSTSNNSSSCDKKFSRSTHKKRYRYAQTNLKKTPVFSASSRARPSPRDPSAAATPDPTTSPQATPPEGPQRVGQASLRPPQDPPPPPRRMGSLPRAQG